MKINNFLKENSLKEKNKFSYKLFLKKIFNFDPKII